MTFYFNFAGIIKGLFNEPKKDKYVLPVELALNNDLVWTSHKEDYKNLANDYKNVRKDIHISFKEYKKRHDG